MKINKFIRPTVGADFSASGGLSTIPVIYFMFIGTSVKTLFPFSQTRISRYILASLHRLWEQVVIYATALFLGTIFGAILAATAVPTLAFTIISAGGVLSGLSSDEFYVFQHIIPAQIVIPLSLWVAFVALVAICTVALWIMASVTLRPSLSQTLRLNED